MKTGQHRFKYVKQIDGRGRYGEVEIEINAIDRPSAVIDDCSWKTLRNAYPDFKELELLKIWKQGAIEAAKFVIETYEMTESVEIKIKDVVGFYVDTFPSHIGAATIVGLFDLIESPLDSEDLRILDDFVGRNSDVELIPDYKNMAIKKTKKH